MVWRKIVKDFFEVLGAVTFVFAMLYFIFGGTFKFEITFDTLPKLIQAIKNYI